MSEKVSHTPGEWTAEPCNHGGMLVRRGDPLRHPQHSLQIVPTADALLIAAAPDLLAALQELVRINIEHNEATSRVIGRPVLWKDYYLDMARAAIAKAMGETP